MKLFKESADTGIYVVNSEYKIVYCNTVLKKSYPNIQCGEICYKSLCGEVVPCKECPMKRQEGLREIIYNKHIGRWVEFDSGMINWPGEGECVVAFLKVSKEGNSNLFYNLTNVSTYDELFELNLSQDTYKLLSHTDDKYVLPCTEGKLSDLRKEVVDGMLHPSDRERFLDFWNLEMLMKEMEEDASAQTLSIEFRRKKTDHTYGWVQQTIVPIRNSSSGDKIAMCFLQDVDAGKKAQSHSEYRMTHEGVPKDELTGLCRRNVFFRIAQKHLKEVNDKEYCMMAIDIEHFKLFNGWYGEEEGDRFLINIGKHLKQAEREHKGLAGYMGSDDFCIILPNNADILTELQEQITSYVKQYEGKAGFLPAFGMYLIDDTSVPLNLMYDRACIAIAQVKGNYSKRVCWYDSVMMQKLEKNHTLLNEVQRALEQEEFTFYSQPKCNLSTGKIVGLESLVRWIHPEQGLIPPGDFIPILERNGFITELDIYVWEKVCIWIRKWIDSGKRAIPVSVNVSRIDIYTLDIVEVFNNLVEKYRLDREFLAIEITESAYVEESQIIRETIDALRKSGFTVLMDDFGSGYSSLNMLKDVNVDVLKIDMKFLDLGGASNGKGFGILEAIIGMAQLMELRVIAEGVETKEQRDLLLDMGCIYAQGYYFYRPLPIHEMEELISNADNLDFTGMKPRQIERISAKELLNGSYLSEAIVNNILGGVAFYDVCDDKVELLRVNEQYYKVMDTNPIALEEKRVFIMDSICESERPFILSIFEKAYIDRINGAYGDVKRFKDDGSMMWLHLRVFFLKEKDNHKIFYGTVEDVTEQKRKEKQLEASQRALSAAVHISNSGESFKKLTKDNQKAATAIFAQLTPGGMIGGYCEEGFPMYFANHEMVRLLGYDSYDEMYSNIGGLVMNTIHEDDRERITNAIGPYIHIGYEYTVTYRSLKKDGSWFWTLDKGKVVHAEDGRMAIISACTDVTETIEIQRELEEQNKG